MKNISSKTGRFISKAKGIHGDKYDYSKVIYSGVDKKVIIICPVHGEFVQTPHDHLKGCGCKRCAIEKSGGRKNKSGRKKEGKEVWLEKVKNVWGDKYDYSKVEYVDSKTKVCVVCPKHGDFYIEPSSHNKHGCPYCGKEKANVARRKSVEVFLKQAKEIHGDKYDYSKVDYKNNHTKVCIVCPVHGEFWQVPSEHLKGAGCIKCYNESFKEKNEKAFFSKCKEKFGNRFTYEKTNYVNAYKSIVVTCPKHGDIVTTPTRFLDTKCICIECRNEEANNKLLEKCKSLYGDTYDFSKTERVAKSDTITVICKKHGEIHPKIENFLRGTGCYKCYLEKQQEAIYQKHYNIASKYTFLIDYYVGDYPSYVYCRDTGLLQRFTWLKQDEGQITNFEKAKTQVVYSYEFQNKVVYVGLTNNLQRRDYEHKSGKFRSKIKPDNVYLYAQEKNVEIPAPKVLESGLTRSQSQILETKWIKQYEKDGWTLLNKNNGGSLGFHPKSRVVVYTKEMVLEEAKKYKNREQMRKNNSLAYTKMFNFGLEDICFPIKHYTQRKRIDYTEEKIQEIVEKYPTRSSLRKGDFASYTYFYRHKLLDKYYIKKRKKS